MFEPRLVIFDLDGTLIEPPLDFLFTQAESILPQLGYPGVTRVQIADYYSKFDMFGFVLQAEKELLTEQFWQIFDWSDFPKPIVIDGVIDTLEELRLAGVQTAIATARTMDLRLLEDELVPTGLLNYLSLVKTRPGEHIHWTDKRGIISAVCSELQVPPEQTMMVGDIPTDITSARDVGIGYTVAVETGGLETDILRGAEPDALLPSVGELLSVVDRSSGRVSL